jgi:arsenate reductase (glutaredoxin)
VVGPSVARLEVGEDPAARRVVAVRRGEAIFAELGLDDPATTPAQLIAAMVDHSILIERPVVLRGDRAVIARPPDRIVELVDAGDRRVERD